MPKYTSLGLIPKMIMIQCEQGWKGIRLSDSADGLILWLDVPGEQFDNR